jgi:hypothetical protein
MPLCTSKSVRAVASRGADFEDLSFFRLFVARRPSPVASWAYFSRNPASFTSRELPPTNTLNPPGSASHLPAAV